MIRDVIGAIGSAAGKIFSNWGATLILLLLYLALLAVLYFFFTTREATELQVALSFLVLPPAAILIFFAMQAMALSYVRIGVGPVYLLKRALKDFWKLLLVSLPLILLAGLITYLAGKAETGISNQIYSAPKPSGQWKLTALSWVRIFLLYFALPLSAVHIWISTVREGLGPGFKGIGRNIARAFAPRSVLTYMLVIVVCGVIAWFLFFTKTPLKSEWGELWLFGARLAMALLFVFLGWLLTLGSLAELTARRVMSDPGE